MTLYTVENKYGQRFHVRADTPEAAISAAKCLVRQRRANMNAEFALHKSLHEERMQEKHPDFAATSVQGWMRGCGRVPRF